MSRSRPYLLAGLLLAAPITNASGQAVTPATDTTRLPELVVTATRLETPRQSLPASVSVITGAELERRGFRFLQDWLQEVPGMAVVETGSFGSVTSLFLRGGESDYVKVLVDGVAMNQPGGSMDFAHLSVADVERVEVVRGPASVLYGSDAVTGVIQVFTRRGRAGVTSSSLMVRGGSFGSSDLRAGFSGGSAGLTWSAAASRFGSRGTYAFNSDYHAWEGSARVAAQPQSGSQVALAVRSSTAQSRFPTDFAGLAVDSNQYTEDRATAVSLEASQRVSARAEFRLQAGLLETRAGYRDTPDGATDRSGYGFDAVRRGDVNRRTVDLRTDLTPLVGVTVSAGVEAWREAQQLRDSTTSDFGGGPFADVSRFRAHRSNVAGYAQVLAELTPAIDLQAGVRQDDNEVFGGFSTWRLGVVTRPMRGLRLHAAAGSAFKQPTFSEQFAKTAYEVGNPTLTPERSTSWELAGEVVLAEGRATLTATWFDQRFRDLIGYLPAGEGEPTYQNVGRALARGAELGVVLRPFASVELSGSLTRLTTRVEDPGPASGAYVKGDPLLRRPAAMARVAAAWRTEGVLLGVDVLTIGARDDMDYRAWPAERITLARYAVVGVSADLALNRVMVSAPAGVALTLRADNLLGAAYETIVGFPGRERTLFAGVRVGR